LRRKGHLDFLLFCGAYWPAGQLLRLPGRGALPPLPFWAEVCFLVCFWFFWFIDSSPRSDARPGSFSPGTVWYSFLRTLHPLDPCWTLCRTWNLVARPPLALFFPFSDPREVYFLPFNPCCLGRLLTTRFPPLFPLRVFFFVFFSSGRFC